MVGSPAAKRYARALYSQAAATGAGDAVEADVRHLGALLAASPELAAFAVNPVVPPDRQQAALERLFANRSHALTQRFLMLLVTRQRLALLAPICAIYRALCDEAHGIVQATITAGRPLDDAQVKAICRRLAERTGKTIEPRVEVDSSLLGGFSIKVGDRVTDLTLRHQLERLRDRIINA